MFWLYITAALLITIGSGFSLLRSESTIDYYRTIVRDGRNDDRAKMIVYSYFAGLGAVGLGVAIIAIGIVVSLLSHQ